MRSGVIVLALGVLACKGKDGGSAGSGSSTPAGSGSAQVTPSGSGSGSGSGSASVSATGAGSGSGSGSGSASGKPDPAVIKALVPANAQAAWQGAWMTKLAMRDGGTSSYTGAWVAMEVTGTTAHVWSPSSKKDHTLTLMFDQPCNLEMREATADGNGYDGFDKKFVISGDTVISGNGGVGFRKDKAAVVCDGSYIYVLDAKGTCSKWTSHFDEWEVEPATCAWKPEPAEFASSDGEKLRLDIDKADYWSQYQVKGDVLYNVHFKDAIGGAEHVKQPDYEAAKAAVQAKFKETDPLERLLSAGAKVGGMSTILDLHATFRDNKDNVKGKPIEVSGLFVAGKDDEIDKAKVWRVTAVDPRDKEKRWELTCYAKAEVKGLKPGAKIKMKGTGSEYWDAAAIKDCVVSR